MKRYARFGLGGAIWQLTETQEGYRLVVITEVITNNKKKTVEEHETPHFKASSLFKTEEYLAAANRCTIDKVQHYTRDESRWQKENSKAKT